MELNSFSFLKFYLKFMHTVVRQAERLRATAFRKISEFAQQIAVQRVASIAHSRSLL